MRDSNYDRLQSAQAGEHAAFFFLWCAVGEKVAVSVARRLSLGDLVMDAVNETFLRLCFRLDQLRANTTRQFAAWVRTAARNISLDILAKQMARRHSWMPASAVPAKESRRASERLLDLLQVALWELSEDERDTLEAVKMHGQSFSRVARRKGAKRKKLAKAVGSTMEHLRKRLLELAEQDTGTASDLSNWLNGGES